MTISSTWPLPPEGVRFFVPKFLAQELQEHPLSRALYPNAMGFYPAAAGHRMERENPDDHLLIFCAHGAGELHLKNISIEVGPGELLLLPKHLPHSYRSNEENPWTLYWIHFDGELGEHYMHYLLDQQRRQSSKKTQSSQQIIALGQHPKLIADFEQLLETRQAGYNLSAFLHASNQLQQLLTYIGMLIPRSKAKAINSIDLDKVHALMQEKLYDRLDLDTLADAMNLSKFHFAKKYKTLTGVTPIQHFIHLKMEKACYLLDISDKSIGEIAELLGYEDAHYFSRLFKRVIGVSPSDYRRLDRG